MFNKKGLGYVKEQKKKLGGNGKVYFNNELKIATKVLKNPKNTNSRIRFIEEMKILKSIKDKNIDNVVKIINIDEQSLKIDMKLYDGDMTKVYNITKGNVRKSLELVLPIIIALKKLSELEKPIYHRDLKPSNLLVETNGEEIKLILADFGCAYINHEENERITDDFRAVGAQQYRAPEYQYGKVEDVNATGDIFSIGKLIWNLMVGNEREVFPYTLWFPKEYNLCERFEKTRELVSLNLLIASCVNYDKNLRTTYVGLINSINNLLNGSTVNVDLTTVMLAKAFESERLIKEVERKEKVKLLLRMFFGDFKKGIINLNDQIDLEMLKSIKEQYITNKEPYIELTESRILANGSEMILFEFRFQEVYMQISYRPKSIVNTLVGIQGVDKDLPYIYSFYGGTKKKSNNMTVFFIDGILHYKSDLDNQYKLYDETTWVKHLNNFIEDYIKL
jgi:serine/threonine protein kinase